MWLHAIVCAYINLLIAGPPEIIIKKEYNEDETVTCVVLADNSDLV